MQVYCRECQRSYVREHYEANRAYYLAKALRSNAKIKTAGRQKLRELKAVPCADCGVQYDPWVMEFDHVRGVKRFNVGDAVGMGLDALVSEAAKCEVVCSNCHQSRTQRRATRP